MKKYLYLLILLYCGNMLHAQNGLLSTNNSIEKRAVTVTPTAPKLPEITAGNRQDLSIPRPAITLSPLMNYEVRIVSLNSQEKSYRDNLTDLQKALKPNLAEKARKNFEVKIAEQNKSLDSVLQIKNSLEKYWGREHSYSMQLLQEKFISHYNQVEKRLDTLNICTQAAMEAFGSSMYIITQYKDKVDSMHNIDNAPLLLDSMSHIWSALNILNNREVFASSTQIHALADKLSAIQFNAFRDSSTQINDSLISIAWNGLQQQIDGYANQLNKDTAEYHDLQRRTQALFDKHITAKPKPQVETKDFGALPQLTSVIGKRETIPQLQLFGNYNYANASSSVQASIGLSVGSTPDADTNSLHSIFIPSASKFLFFSKFTYAFATQEKGADGKDSLAKRLAVNLDISYAGKQFIYDTSKRNSAISSSVLYTKTGLEFGILPTRFSIYANINTVTIMDKVDEFRKAAGVDSKFFGFIDCGAKLYLDPTPSSKVDGLFIFSNLNFIINSGDVKRITHSNDVVIPSIQIGIVKTLNIF